MEETNTHRRIEILLVEDNPDDVELTLEAFKEARFGSKVHVAGDGEAALHFLRRKRPYGNAPRPDLILLDLNLPRRNGREVLAEVKSDPDLRDIPIVVLTTSRAEEDICESYRLHVNCYITKPVDMIQFISVIKAIEEFWFATVSLPSRN